MAALNDIHTAAEKGDTPRCVELILSGIDPHVRSSFLQQTPLHRATRFANKETMLALIDLGASVHVKDSEGETPLHYAAQTNFADICSVLVEHGACLNEQNNRKETPLHTAARWARFDAVVALIRCGGDVHKPQREGHTPLEVAAVQRYRSTERVCMALLAHGAVASTGLKMLNPVEELDAITPRQAAARGGLTDRMIDLLREQPTETPGDSPIHLMTLALARGHHHTAAAIQSHIAMQAIEAISATSKSRERSPCAGATHP